MRTNYLVFPLFLLVGSSFPAALALSQETGTVPFDVTASALVGTVSCNGGPATSIGPVDVSTTNVSGSDDQQASNLTAQACGGLPLYSITFADDSTSASDVVGQDDAIGGSNIQGFNLLGGLVTFDKKIESDTCAVVSGTTVGCQGTATIQGLHFAGQPITGNFLSPTTFNAINVQIQGVCPEIALFSGSLTIGATTVQHSGSIATVEMIPVGLKGTVICGLLPTVTMQVDLQDWMKMVDTNDVLSDDEFEVFLK
jgi:hypothetical protein